MKKVLSAYEEALVVGSTDTASEPNSPVEASKVKAAWKEGDARRTVPKPRVYPGLSIDEYGTSHLEDLIAYYRSDGVLRTRDEELEWVVRKLGFSRKGSKIVAAIRAAQLKVDQLR
jgi:hypothetical protein